MKSYTMTQEQTGIFDGRSDAARSEMWTAIRQEVKSAPETYGDYVEVYTADGIVADVIDLR